VTLVANPQSVTSGASTTLNWSSTNASSCTASGSWSGSRSTSGSMQTGPLTATSTFTLLCTGAGGSRSASTTVSVSGSGSKTGLDFPSNEETEASESVQFRFTGAALLKPFPATYIWRIRPRQQAGYYTTFFWGPDGAFTGAGYYGAHPYPNPPPNGVAHNWEISARGLDVTADQNGNNTTVQKDVWHTQALTVQEVANDELLFKFYWSLPDTSKVIVYETSGGSAYANSFPSGTPALTFGDAPWSPGNESLSGLFRGLQIYSSTLSLADLLTEAGNDGTNLAQTAAGRAALWYMNQNPTPSDIADKSGAGHHPAWRSANRPRLWSE
jgi:hypothetical protein